MKFVFDLTDIFFIHGYLYLFCMQCCMVMSAEGQSVCKFVHHYVLLDCVYNYVHQTLTLSCYKRTFCLCLLSCVLWKLNRTLTIFSYA